MTKAKKNEYTDNRQQFAWRQLHRTEWIAQREANWKKAHKKSINE